MNHGADCVLGGNELTWTWKQTWTCEARKRVVGSVQCAVQTSGLDSTSTRLFTLLAPTDSDPNLVVVGGLEGWLFVPARAGQDRDLERQERGAFADMGKEHMGISAGGVAYQRSFFSRGVSPTGGLYQSASPFNYSLPVQHCIRTHTHQAKHRASPGVWSRSASHRRRFASGSGYGSRNIFPTIGAPLETTPMPM